MLDTGELGSVCRQMSPLIERASGSEADVITTAAASARLHSFYSEIEKIFALIARKYDNRVPNSSAWHKELLIQMSQSTPARPPVITPYVVDALGDYLAFRDLFRETAVTLMRWDKLAPLLARVPEVTGELTIALAIFAHHLASSGDTASPPL